MERRSRMQDLWGLPWLVFLAFPAVDLVVTPRPLPLRLAAGVGLLAFTGAYVTVFYRTFGRRTGATGPLLAVAGLAVALAVRLGPSWCGLFIYLSAALAVAVPRRWVWPAVAAAAAACAAVTGLHGRLGDLYVLPLLCLLTAFAVQGVRYLVSVNAELLEAREDRARSAVAEERLRFARDLHDLLGHSLSMIALKSELARRLAERDPGRAAAEMADVEAAARRALAEVRDAVSGYRQVSLDQALAEARSALSAAGIALRAPRAVPPLPAAVDAVLGWVVREATTNVLRHSGAGSVVVEVAADDGEVSLSMTDDGRGPGAAGDRPGVGLSGLAERVSGLGGRLDRGAAGPGGFRLEARLPLRAPVREPAP